MTKEQMIAHWIPIVNAVLVAENNLPDEEREKLKAARGTGSSKEQWAIEAYMRAIATEIVENGAVGFADDEDES